MSWAHSAGFTDVTVTSSTWCYASAEQRECWGGMWADRILDSAIAGQLTGAGLATPADLREISDAWTQWAADPDGWISILHGELIYRIPQERTLDTTQNRG